MLPSVRRIISAATAWVVLAMVLAGVMEARCLMAEYGCCPPAVLSFSSEDPCADCIAPEGPEVAPFDLADRSLQPAPVLLALPVVPAPLDTTVIIATKPGPSRSDQVPIRLKYRVLRV